MHQSNCVSNWEQLHVNWWTLKWKTQIWSIKLLHILLKQWHVGEEWDKHKYIGWNKSPFFVSHLGMLNIGSELGNGYVTNSTKHQHRCKVKRGNAHLHKKKTKQQHTDKFRQHTYIILQNWQKKLQKNVLNLKWPEKAFCANSCWRGFQFYQPIVARANRLLLYMTQLRYFSFCFMDINV